MKTRGEDARFRLRGLVCLFDYFLIVAERDIFPTLPGSGSGYPVFTSLRAHCYNTFPISTPGFLFSASSPAPASVCLSNSNHLGAGTGIILVFSFAFLMATGVLLSICISSFWKNIFSNWILLLYLGVVKLLHILISRPSSIRYSGRYF